MLVCALGFLTGICLLNTFAQLPSVHYAYSAFLLGWVLISLALVKGYYFKSPPILNTLSGFNSLLASIFLGWAWSLLHASAQLAHSLPPELEGQLLLARGLITSIPEIHQQSSYFNFAINSFSFNGKTTSAHYQARLSWYGKQRPVLRIGEQWQLSIKLKRPHGILNPGGFDYERLLFEQGIQAQGYVYANSINQRLLAASPWSLAHLRECLYTGIQQSLHDKAGKGLIAALVVGMRDQITATQWLTMQATGTNHLMAIAGLHIGFVSGFIYSLSSWLWRRSLRLILMIPAAQIAAIMALLSALLYSALAGFALPTQRAVIMLAVFLLASLLKRHLPVWQAWSCALFAILIARPLSTLADSFWLSFGSVAIILYGSRYRLRPKGLWWKYFHIQWVIGIGLIPLTVWFFQQISLTGFLANAIAIPWVGFIILPLSAIGGTLYFFSTEFAAKCWQLAEYLLMIMWHILEAIGTLTAVQWPVFLPSYTQLCAVVMGCLLWVAPRGLPVRWLGIIWLLPLLQGGIRRPAANELWLTVLDVGQGLATVIHTAQHTLVYDTGPQQYNANYDMGSVAVIPYLRSLGIISLDALIISHADNDHSGGAAAIIRAMPVAQLFTSYAQHYAVKQHNICHAGIVWQWDGAHFEFLNPILFKQKHNDNSCVLKITFGEHSVLLTGDIEKKREAYLLNHTQFDLSAALIIAPHHGSHSSSTSKFIAQVQPRYAVFSVGYRNRFHFPHPDVVTRYKQQGATIYQTDSMGAVTFRFQRNSSKVQVEQYRQRVQRFWHLSLYSKSLIKF